MVEERVTLCTTSTSDSPLLYRLVQPWLICACAHIVLIIYEYLVTVDSEVRLFWGKQITGASILFFTNRYMMFFYVLFFLWTYSPLTVTRSVSPDMLNMFRHHS